MTSPAEAIQAAKNKLADQAKTEAAQESGAQATQAFASSIGNSTQLQAASTIPQASQAAQNTVTAEDVQTLQAAETAQRVTVAKSNAREFQHVYAGAGVNLKNGKRLTFGGAPGSNGRYVTDREDEIAYLEELANTQGSQVTEIFRDSEGREVARGAGSSLASDFQRAARDAAANTVADADPNVNTARNNLPNVIKMNG